MKLFKKTLMICSIFFIVGCSPKEDEPDIPVVVEPVIELAELEISSEEITLEIGNDFEFPTVSCSDNGEACEATLVGEYDFSEVGEYTVTYTYENEAGTVEVTCTVCVVDTEAPTILSIEDVTIPLGTDYIQAEIDFSDNYDENSVLEVEGTVDINTVGSYPITFTVTDSSNNISTFVHYVHVVDEIAPTITLLGDASLTVYRGREYTEAGYEVSDNYDTDLVVTVSGIVDTDTDGTYTLVYIVSDSSGNESSTERVITVKRKPSSGGGSSSSSSSTPPPAPDPIAITNTASGLSDTEITILTNRNFTEIIYVSGVLDYANEHSGLWETVTATSSFTVSGLIETGYEFAVKDSAGQVSPVYSVVIDTTTPVIETTYYVSTGTTDTIPGHDRYANSVDFNDGVLTVGAPDALSGELIKIFREDEQAQIVLSYSASEIGFGSDATIEGDYLLVGAPNAKGPNNEEIGEVSIYDADSGIKEMTFSYSLFFSSGLSEHYMYVEGDGVSIPNTFRLIDITFGSTYPTITDPITANDLVMGIHNDAISALKPVDGHLGENLDADGDYFVASSYTDSGLGFVYLGSFSDSGFRRIIHGGEVNHIGFDVAIDGDNIVTTAKDLNGDLYAYLFKVGDPDYVETLTLSYGGEVNYNLPSIDVKGDYVALGSDFDSMDSDTNAGAVYLLKISDETFERRITSDTQMAYDYFGSSVDITGDYIAIGAMGRGKNEGRVYLYSISQDDIVNEYQESSDGDMFGFTVALSEDKVYVGTGTSNYLKTFNKLSGYKVEITDENTQTVVVTKDGNPYTMMDNFIDENFGIFVIEATDIAGNVGSGVLDLDPPVLDNLDGLVVHVNTLTPTISANKEFKYRLEGSGDWSELSSGLSLVIPSGLSEGSTGIYVQAANGATSELHYVRVDTIAPVFTVDYLGDKYRVNYTETNFDYITATNASGVYQLTSTTDILDDGTYEITVFDKAGNASSGIYVCDLTAPIIQNTSGIIETSGIAVTADESFVEISTNSGVNWTTISSTTSYDLTGLAEGIYNILVKDDTGNVSDVYTVKVNAITPTITNTETKTQGDVTINTNEEISSIQIDGGTWLESSGLSHDYTDLTEGSHTVIFKDVTDIESAPYTFTVDTTAPTLSGSGVTIIGNNIIVNTSGFTVLSDEDFIEIRPNSATPYTQVAATSTYEFTNLTNDQQLMIKAKDEVGNESDYLYAYIDTELTIKVTETSTAGTFRVDVTSDEYTGSSSAGYLHIVIMSGMTEICNEYNAEGVQYFSNNCNMTEEATYDITVTDGAGHTAVLQFKLDTVAPTILTPTDQTYSSGVINITTDEEFVEYSLDNGSNWILVPSTDTLAVSGLTDGTIFVRVKDAAGNESATMQPVVYVKTSATSITHTVTASGIYEVYTEETRSLEEWTVYKDSGLLEVKTNVSYSADEPYGDGSFAEETLNQPGYYVIEAIDKWGFSMTYSFTIPEPPA